MYVSTVTRARGRRRLLAVVVIMGAIAAVLAVAAGALALAERGKLPARTVVGGVSVGGKTEAEARSLLERAARSQRLRSVEVTADSGHIRLTVTGALLGAQPRIDDALSAADGTGLPSRLARRLGFGAARAVPLTYGFDRDRLDRLGSELDARVAIEPRDATLSVEATGASVRPSEVGRSVDNPALERRLRTLPETVVVPLTTLQPTVTTDEAEQAATVVRSLLGAPRTVAVGTTAVTLQPALVRRALVVDTDDDGLAVSLDRDLLGRRLRPAFRDRLRQPRDAGFRIAGKRVVVVPSAPGKELDVDAIARSLLANVGSTVHRARFRPVVPALTTEEARALGIREKVSEFTTYYPCCAPRVTNIQRAAQILDGTVVPPGGRFSLNDALGKRTFERGFLSAPQILAGRLEDAVGGGVSQVATTMFNAAFFAGLRLDVHQPHEFYISRYPMGREATVSWGGPELVFTNDWKAGLLIKVSAWSTGIRIGFYSTKLGRRVETVTGDPYGYVQPRTRLVKNPALKPGERKVVQEAGPAGFTVEFTRKVYRGDKLIKDEQYRTRYRAENAFVEIGPKKPKPKPEPKPGPPRSGPTPAEPTDDAAAQTQPVASG